MALKQRKMKYQFLGKPNLIYNFPAIKIYGVTVETFNDFIGEALIKAGKTDLVKLAKADKKEA